MKKKSFLLGIEQMNAEIKMFTYPSIHRHKSLSSVFFKWFHSESRRGQRKKITYFSLQHPPPPHTHTIYREIIRALKLKHSSMYHPLVGDRTSPLQSSLKILIITTHKKGLRLNYTSLQTLPIVYVMTFPLTYQFNRAYSVHTEFYYIALWRHYHKVIIH